MDLLEIYKNFKEEVETEKEAVEYTLKEVQKWKYLVKAYKHTQGQFDIESRKCYCFATEGVDVEMLEGMDVSLTSYHDNEDSYLRELLDSLNASIKHDNESDKYIVLSHDIEGECDSLWGAIDDLRKKNIDLIDRYKKDIDTIKEAIKNIAIKFRKTVFFLEPNHYSGSREVVFAKAFEEAYEEMEVERFENACGDWTIKVYKTDELEAWELEEILGG